MEALEFRNVLIEKLYNYLKFPVIPSDEDQNIPDPPYVVYTITSDYQKKGQDTLRFTQDESGFKQVYENLLENTYSFNVHSNKRDEAFIRCHDIIKYFDRLGRDELSFAGITVVGVSNPQNRSVMLVDHYERRYGVDVRFRYFNKTEQSIENIETVKISQGGK